MENQQIDGARIIGGPLNMVPVAVETENVGWIISVINSDMMPETPRQLTSDRHLKLAMNDISDERDGLVRPSSSHVADLIGFVDRWDMELPMMVHCWAGVSRSTAGIFIALCRLNEEMDEGEIALALRIASPTATPNLRMVTLADDYLGRSGRMVDAVKMIGRGDMAFEGLLFSIPAKLSEPAG